MAHHGPVHADQVVVGREQVVALVSDQLPHLAGLDVVPVPGAGTVNAIFRIGADIVARFPLRRRDPEQVRRDLDREVRAATEFAAVCPIAAPLPVHVGEPGHGYPMPWLAQTWAAGTTATPTSCENSQAFADDLTALIGRLHQTNTRGRHFRGIGRGGVLTDHDRWIGE